MNPMQKQFCKLIVFPLLCLLFTACDNKRSTSIKEPTHVASFIDPHKELNASLIGQKLSNVELSTIDGNKEPLYHVLSNIKLVFYFSPDNSCLVCIDDAVEKLKEVSKESGSENILIITKHTNLRELSLFKSKYQLELSVAMIDESLHDTFSKPNAEYEQILLLMEGYTIKDAYSIKASEPFSNSDSFFKKAAKLL